MRYGNKILFFVVVLTGFFIAGMQQFAHQIRLAAAPAIDVIPSEDDMAIVVVTGSGGRIEAGFNLMLSLDAKRMLISGIGDGVSKDDILGIVRTHHALKEATLKSRLDCCVDLGALARNTRGNANEAVAWIDQHQLSSIILVTSDFHMPRTLMEFRRAMPAHDTYPYPVATRGLGLDAGGQTEWWKSGARLFTISREYSKYLASFIA